MAQRTRTYQDAADRWAGVGPYYAMFPVHFADQIVERYTEPGETVLDPFAGRGTAIFSAAARQRGALGIEINPVGYVYGRAKLNPAEKEAVQTRLEELVAVADRFAREASALPEFFHWCFARKVQQFLLAARSTLDWRRSKVDRTTMALLLVYLHGKKDTALSNQMRQTKAMSPGYAISWWRERDLKPPDIDVLEFMEKRLDWRYAKGTPDARAGKLYLGDSVRILRLLETRLREGSIGAAKLLFTSPPYYKVTNYHYDQWLRLWLLGGPPNARRYGAAKRGKFEHREDYKILLERVFLRASHLLSDDATVYVRTDRRKFTYKTTADVLRQVFPKKRFHKKNRPFRGQTQTYLFGDKAAKVGEVDIVLTP